MANTSAIVLTWNEQELLPKCLDFLERMTNIGEVVILDSYSTDNTIPICKEYCRKTSKRTQLVQRKFPGFADQWNFGIDLCTLPWIFYVAADETWTNEFDKMLAALDNMPHINYVRTPTFVTFQDERHYIDGIGDDPQVRLFRRGFARFEGKVLEEIIDINGRKLMMCYDADGLNCGGPKSPFPHTWRKHHQLLKSKESLKEKGQRWAEMDLLRLCAEKGIPVNAESWASWKDVPRQVKALPEIYL